MTRFTRYRSCIWSEEPSSAFRLPLSQIISSRERSAPAPVARGGRQITTSGGDAREDGRCDGDDDGARDLSVWVGVGECRAAGAVRGDCFRGASVWFRSRRWLREDGGEGADGIRRGGNGRAKRSEGARGVRGVGGGQGRTACGDHRQLRQLHIQPISGAVHSLPRTHAHNPPHKKKTFHAPAGLFPQPSPQTFDHFIHWKFTHASIHSSTLKKAPTIDKKGSGKKRPKKKTKKHDTHDALFLPPPFANSRSQNPTTPRTPIDDDNDDDDDSTSATAGAITWCTRTTRRRWMRSAP